MLLSVSSLNDGKPTVIMLNSDAENLRVDRIGFLLEASSAFHQTLCRTKGAREELNFVQNSYFYSIRLLYPYFSLSLPSAHLACSIINGSAFLRTFSRTGTATGSPTFPSETITFLWRYSLRGSMKSQSK